MVITAQRVKVGTITEGWRGEEGRRDLAYKEQYLRPAWILLFNESFWLYIEHVRYKMQKRSFATALF